MRLSRELFIQLDLVVLEAIIVNIINTIKGGSRRAKKSCKVLMMMKAAKLGWAGAGARKKQGWTKTRARKGRRWAGQEQGISRNWAGVG